MKIYISANAYTEVQKAQAVSLCDRLGHSCALELNTAEGRVLPQDAPFTPEEADLIVSLGGDGAVLRASKIAVSAGKPLFGINSGRLGYLCALRYEDAADFDRVLSECTLSKRTLLQCKLDGQSYTALNDVVVTKMDLGESVDLSCTMEDGEPLHIRGDGLIVATPTGSTAYNLSAGGPVLDASAKAFVLTPICSHASLSHAIVLPDERPLSVRRRTGNALVFVDGKNIGALTDAVQIQKADRTLLLYSGKGAKDSLVKLV